MDTIALKKKFGKKAEFEFYAPEAKEVKIAGDFNAWEAQPLKKEKDGRWKLSLNLPSGRYEYRFLVDGGWQNDQRPVVPHDILICG